MRAFDQPAYLGLDRDGRWAALVAEGVARYGTHYAGSRGASYCPSVYAEAEGQLKDWLGAPATTLVSSGSLLATMLTDALWREGHVVLSGPLAHACWRWAGTRAFASADAWRRAAFEAVALGRRVAVVTDRVCVMRCVEADLTWWQDLPASATVVVDDSHAIGVHGEGGRGSWGELRGLAAEVLVCASLGKAFSVPGAVLVSSAPRAQAFRTTAAFGGASSVPPAYAHALAEGLEYALGRRKRLLGHVRALAATDVRHVHDHPAFLIGEGQAGALALAGVRYAQTRYPTAESPEVRRVVVSAGHRAEEVAEVARALGAGGL